MESEGSLATRGRWEWAERRGGDCLSSGLREGAVALGGNDFG